MRQARMAQRTKRASALAPRPTDVTIGASHMTFASPEKRKCLLGWGSEAGVHVAAC